MKKEDYSCCEKMKNPDLDTGIEDMHICRPQISKVEYQDVNRIFEKETLQHEIGFVKLKNGGYLVAMETGRPDVKRKMVRWWFWRHVQEKEHQIVYPGEHLSIRYSSRNKDYFNEPYGDFEKNTVYPVGRAGKKVIRLFIQFVHPRTFGISESNIKRTENGFLFCGFVGVMKGMRKHTKMLHYFKSNGDGIRLISRFGLGNGLPRVLESIGANRQLAYARTKHCSIEYNRLGFILPELYNTYK